MVNVACVGLTTIDIVQEVEHMPADNEKMVANNFYTDFGGPAANAARIAKIIGADVELLTALGQGDIADLAKRLLCNTGIKVYDAASEAQDCLPVSSILLQVKTANRAVISANGKNFSNYVLSGTNMPDNLEVLLVDGHNMPLCLTAVKLVQSLYAPAQKPIVLLDAGSWKAGLEEIITYVDFPLFSADFRVPSGMDPIGWALEQGCKAVGVSQGAAPIVYATAQGERGLVDPPTNKVAVDTLGAGDVLHGALAYALAITRGSLDKVQLAIEFAVTVASCSTWHRRTTGWMNDPVCQQLIAQKSQSLTENNLF